MSYFLYFVLNCVIFSFLVNKHLELISLDCFIDHKHGLTTSTLQPKSLTLLKTVRLSSPPLSVCHCGHDTYVGLQDGTVSRIDENFTLHEKVLTCMDAVAGIVLYKDRIYTLVYGSPMTINVHDLSSGLITSWQHTDSVPWCNKLAVVADRLVVPDRTNGQLTIYSLTGEILSKVGNFQFKFSHKWLSMCSFRNNSVIISDYQSDLVVRIDVLTGHVLWTNLYTIEPLGVASYGQNNLLVVSSDCRVIEVLNIQTGEFSCM